MVSVWLVKPGFSTVGTGTLTKVGVVGSGVIIRPLDTRSVWAIWN